jgi:hypothetical protein
VKVQNLSATDTLHLGRWWVRDAMLRRFTFPDGTDLAPGATLTLHVGSGQASPGDLFWGLPRPIFENAYGTPGRDLGDGAYLFDPQGDLRGWLIYPCLVDCTDPLAGAVTVQAYPRAPEHVVVRNVSSAAVDLYGYALSVPGSAYAFGQPTVLAPGAALTVTVQGDPRRDTAGTHAMGLDGYKLPDAGGVVRLVTFSYIVVACDSWGNGRCS